MSRQRQWIENRHFESGMSLLCTTIYAILSSMSCIVKHFSWMRFCHHKSTSSVIWSPFSSWVCVLSAFRSTSRSPHAHSKISCLICSSLNLVCFCNLERIIGQVRLARPPSLRQPTSERLCGRRKRDFVGVLLLFKQRPSTLWTIWPDVIVLVSYEFVSICQVFPILE